MIRRFTTFATDQMSPLIAQSQQEGFLFLARLHDEWMNGVNRFEKPGVALFGLFADGKLIGLGGINRVDQITGRLRRFYISPSYRRQGCGGLLLHHILLHAAAHFSSVVLRTDTIGGDRFYRACGFLLIPESHDPTHRITLASAEQCTASKFLERSR